MLTVVTFKWRPRPGYRSKFDSSHVNMLARMVARHYDRPHRFVCITDDPTGLAVEHVPLWADHAGMRNPTWPDGPSCFRRLRLFDREMGNILGPRFVCLDLDMVIVNDLKPLFDRPEPFVMFKTHLPQIPLCGSMLMMDAGVHHNVWSEFDANPVGAVQMARTAGWRGSDQAWITYKLWPRVATWNHADGVFSYMELVPKRRRGVGAFPFKPHVKLPYDARIVVFTGKPDPWDQEALHDSPWIAEHYRP